MGCFGIGEGQVGGKEKCSWSSCPGIGCSESMDINHMPFRYISGWTIIRADFQSCMRCDHKIR